MPPRRKRAKATKSKAETPVEDEPEPLPKPKATRRRVRLPQLPIELWRMIIKEACSYPLEMEYGEESPRAMAALGYHNVPTFNRTGGLDARRLAYQTRRTVICVNKVWWAIGQEHLYHTIFINESSRPLFPDLLGQFLRRRSLGPCVRRLELNFDITKESVESVGSLLRGFIKNCPNLEVIDDHIIRKNTSTEKRAVSPIRIAPQAANEIPFAIALGNKHKKTIKYLNFSPGSAAAFTYTWSINLLNRFENIQILSLHEFPGWQRLPLPLSPQELEERRERINTRREQRRRSRYRSYRDSDDEDDPDADDATDDEYILPDPIKLPHLHTLDISCLPNTDKPMARALTHWLKGWEIPALKQLGLSIYNFESIPFPLLHHVAPTLKLLVLHHFNVKYLRPPAAGSAGDQQAQGQASTRIDPLHGKVIEFPEIERMVVTGESVVPDWKRLFDCPKLSTYCIQWHTYRPTPYNPHSNGLESPTPRWSSTEKLRGHLKAAYNDMPRLVNFQVLDVPFKSMEIPDDDIRFWRAVERELKQRKITTLGAESIAWKDCRPADETAQLRKRKLEAERLAAEKAAAEKAAAEKAAAEKEEAEKLAAEKAEAEKLEAEKAAAVEALQKEGEPSSLQATNSGDSGPAESQETVIHVPETQESSAASNLNTQTQETEATTNNPNGD